MLRNADYIYENVLKADGVNSTLDYCKKAQVGVDLSVKSFKQILTPGCILKSKSIVSQIKSIPKKKQEAFGNTFTGWYLEKGTYILELNEGCAFGSNDTGLIILRSSFNRCGCTVVSAVWDPGYTSVSEEDVSVGTMSVRFTVDTANGVYVEENARIAQLLVFENEEASLYSGQFQGGRFESKLV